MWLVYGLLWSAGSQTHDVVLLIEIFLINMPVSITSNNPLERLDKTAFVLISLVFDVFQ